MPLETQDNFVQGLNDRLPPYKIPQEAVQEALNCDFSYGDVRGIKGVGSSGGGKEFFYESGNSWVGKSGTGGQTGNDIVTFTTNTTISSNATYGTPITVQPNVTLTVNQGVELTAAETIVGLSTAQGFVEYNEDLYISRDEKRFVIPTIVNNSLQIDVGTNIYDFIVGDEIVNDCVDDGTRVIEIDVANSLIHLNKPTVSAGTNILNTIKCVPVRFVDGDLTNIYSVGLPKPIIGTIVGQLVGTNANWALSYAANWYSVNYPVAFQYGIAQYDTATLAEGVLSDLSDVTQSKSAIKTSNNNIPATVSFNYKKVIPATSVTANNTNPIVFDVPSHGIQTGETIQFTSTGVLPSPLSEGVVYYAITVDQGSIRVASTSANAHAGTAINHDGNVAPTGDITLHYGGPEDGKYAVYRTGGSSSVLKKVCNLYYKNNFYISSVTSSSSCLDIVPENFPSGAKLKAYFYSTDGITKYNEGHTFISSSATLTGSAEYNTSDNTFHISKQGTGSHKVVIVITCTFPGTDDDREYILTGDTGGSIHVEGTSVYYHHLIDATPARSLIDIQPIQEGEEPPRGLKHITEVNDFFYGSIGKRLHISAYGRPNVWPLDGFVDFDGTITAIKRRGGELIVFMDNGIYRVYGTSHNNMRKVKVPTVEGVKEGLHRCIAPIRDGLIYVSHSGISYFNGRDVEVLTQLRLGEFQLPSDDLYKNTAGVIEDVYYVLGPTGNGYVLDLRFGTMKLSKCSIRSENLFYRGIQNKLYNENGVIGEGDLVNFTFRTRAFTGGSINDEKILKFIRLSGFDFTGRVELYVDSNFIEHYNISSSGELNRGIYPSLSLIGNIFSLRFYNCSGRVQTVSMELEKIEKSQLKRFDSITISYIGSLSVSVKVDNKESIDGYELPYSGIGNTATATLYFPPMTEGYIAHLIAQEDESNRVMSYDIAGEAI